MATETAGIVGEPPAGDAFYQPPGELSGAHGGVIWSRPLDGPAVPEAAGRCDLALYQSQAVDGTAIGVSGIVALPTDPPGEHGYPVVSWAHGTLGLGSRCAPSVDSVQMAQDLPEHHAINQAPHVMLNAFLRQGWAVVMTDYEGMGTPGTHPYLLGQSEAYGVLDMVRAARQLHPQISARLAVVGHSQGGQAALFAGQYAPQWTPELDLRTVAVLAPASHVRDGLLRGSVAAVTFPGFAFTPLLLSGAIVGSQGGATANGNPIDPGLVLTDQAMGLFGSSGCKCRVELSRADSWGGILGTAQFRGDIVHNPNGHQQEFLRQLELTNPALRVAAPIRIAHAQADPRVMIADTNTLVGELGGQGNDVYYRIYAKVGDGGELGAHFGIFETDTPDMTTWLGARLGS